MDLGYVAGLVLLALAAIMALVLLGHVLDWLRWRRRGDDE